MDFLPFDFQLFVCSLQALVDLRYDNQSEQELTRKFVFVREMKKNEEINDDYFLQKISLKRNERRKRRKTWEEIENEDICY